MIGCVWFPYCYVIFIPLIKLHYSFHILILDPFSEAFPFRMEWGEFELDINSILQTLLELTSSSSSSLGNERFGMADVPTSSSSSNNLFSSFGCLIVAVSALMHGSKETCLGLSTFFLDGVILKICLSSPWEGER